MRRKNKNRSIILIVLIVCVFGLSVGFSVLSNILTIKPAATVDPNPEGFKIVFSKSIDSIDDGTIEPTYVSSSDIKAGPAIIEGTKISGMSVTFTEPDQEVVYSIYAYNAGSYVGYLKNIIFESVPSYETNKVCTALPGTYEFSVESQCDTIDVRVQVGTSAPVNTSTYNLKNKYINIGEGQLVNISLHYRGGGDAINGDFTVKIGDIKLQYSTTDY